MIRVYGPLLALATALACARGPEPVDQTEGPRVETAERQPGAGAAGAKTPPASRPADTPGPVAAEPVLTGVDVLAAEGPGALRGLRVGLITNHTGVDRNGRSTIDVLAAMPDVRLVALFGPEHGIRGVADAGERVNDGRDDRTGLPVYSLLDESKAPTDAEMAMVDALVFDMQDVGARYYSYPWTMVMAMQAARRANALFLVLDRPNPITGALIQGNVAVGPPSLMGMFAVPMRHGMTVGEIARMADDRLGIEVSLVVVPMTGWRRSQWYDESGLGWIPPSPNMPSVESALHYPGTCLFEMTSLAVGRGGPTPFQQIGAPWLDNVELARRLNALDLPGVRFDTLTFAAVNPQQASHLGERDPGVRRGVRWIATDRAAYDPTRAAVHALVEIQRMHPDRLQFSENFDLLAGTPRLREQVRAGASAEQILAEWDAQLVEFARQRLPYLLY